MAERKLVMDKIIKTFIGVLNAEFSMLALPELLQAFKMAFKSHFKKIAKEARLAEFKKFRDEAKKAVLFDGLNARQKNTVNVRLWRAGKLVGIKLGKTPSHKKTGKPPKPPVTPPDGNGGNESMVDGIGSKAPKEREQAWRLMAQVVKEKTGWNFARFMKEVGPLLKEVLG